MILGICTFENLPFSLPWKFRVPVKLRNNLGTKQQNYRGYFYAEKSYYRGGKRTINYVYQRQRGVIPDQNPAGYFPQNRRTYSPDKCVTERDASHGHDQIYRSEHEHLTNNPQEIQ